MWKGSTTLNLCPMINIISASTCSDTKSYLSSTLLFRLASYQMLMVKYIHPNYAKLNSFIERLPSEHREQFWEIIAEGWLLARTSLQASLEAAESAVCSFSVAVVMRQTFWPSSQDFQGRSRILLRTFLLVAPNCGEHQRVFAHVKGFQCLCGNLYTYS